MKLLLPSGEGWDEGRIYLNYHSHEAMLFVISAKAEIQVLNVSRALRAISTATCGWLTHGS